MLALRASSAFVCIRCELHLARPRASALSRRASHATFSASTRSRDAFDDASPSQASGPRPRGEVSPRPLGKIRKRKGEAALRETTARLGGVKTLGRDAEILVLTEEGDAPQEDVPTPQAPPSGAPESFGIVASLQQESGKFDPEEINRLLESLRPKTHADPAEPQYISQATFVKLNKTLYEGFTVQQLSRYFSVRKGVQQERVKQEVLDGLKSPNAAGAAKTAIERTEWHPGTTPLVRRLPGANVTPGPKRRPISKHLLVDQILRNVWNLVLLEEIEAPGEIELSLKYWQLCLLNVGVRPTALDRIGSARKAKIEVHWQQNVLRITADKSTAEYAVDDVEQVLQNTEKQMFNTEQWLSFMAEKEVPTGNLTSVLSQQDLQTAGKLSGTFIQTVSPHQLLIRGLDKKSVEETQRCLIQMLPLRSPSSRTIESQILDAAKERSYILPTAFKSSLDYRFRSLNLGRWVLPVSQLSNHGPTLKEEPSANVADPNSALAGIEPDGIQTRVVKALQGSSRESSYEQLTTTRETDGSDHSTLWGRDRNEVENRVSAEFVQVLVPANDNKLKMPEPDLKTALSGTSHALISRVFPGLSEMLADEAFSVQNHSPVPSLVYEFTPSPNQRHLLLPEETYPSLEIRFKSLPGSKPRLKDVTLRFNERFHDVLLPDKAVDVRFRSHQRLRMFRPGHNQHLREFSEAVCDNIESGARLTAPSTLKIKVPLSIIPGLGHDDSRTRLVTYLFAGIQYRQSVASKFEGQSVSYNTVQTGKLGPKGGSLSSHYNTDVQNGDPDLSNARALGEFVKTSLAIADRITKAAANNKPVSKVLRPRDHMSARKVRRQAASQEEEELQNGATYESLDGGVDAPYRITTEVDTDLPASPEVDIKNGQDDEDPHFASLLSKEDFSERHEDVTTGSAAVGATKEMDEPSLTIADSDVELGLEEVAHGEEKKTLQSSALAWSGAGAS